MKRKNKISFRLNQLKLPSPCYLKYLAFWPIFELIFYTLERLWIRSDYFPVHCLLDERIPFCEYFLIPYLFWFVLVFAVHAYTLFFDTDSFVRLMKFTIISYGLALAIYIVFPNCQELRPTVFARNNILTRVIGQYYCFDTNTNVCPSLHVIGSVSVMLCAWKSKALSKRGWKVFFAVMTILISASTLFLKQHSVIDLIVAMPVCFIAYSVAYREPLAKVNAASLFLPGSIVFKDGLR